MTRVAVILVGHGGVPSDYPRENLSKLKALEGRRRASGGPITAEEARLDAEIRGWPRTAENDPYRAGFERVAAALTRKIGDARLWVAYNEMCAPTLEEAIRSAIEEGATEITVVPSMLTPGGVHSEVEIPEVIAALRPQLPNVILRYAWPFDLDRVADLLAQQVAAAR